MINVMCVLFWSIYRSTALSIKLLKSFGVTAVLNAAQGEMSDWNYINTKASYYSRDNIRFLGVPAFDSKTYPISQHFEEASHFIDEEIRLRKGIPIYFFLTSFYFLRCGV